MIFPEARWKLPSHQLFDFLAIVCSANFFGAVCKLILTYYLGKLIRRVPMFVNQLLNDKTQNLVLIKSVYFWQPVYIWHHLTQKY